MGGRLNKPSGWLTGGLQVHAAEWIVCDAHGQVAANMSFCHQAVQFVAAFNRLLVVNDKCCNALAQDLNLGIRLLPGVGPSEGDECLPYSSWEL